MQNENEISESSSKWDVRTGPYKESGKVELSNPHSSSVRLLLKSTFIRQQTLKCNFVDQARTRTGDQTKCFSRYEIISSAEEIF